MGDAHPSRALPTCPDCNVIHDGDDFHDWCNPDDRHVWGPWHFAQVGNHEIRFCGRCGGMEQQWVSND